MQVLWDVIINIQSQENKQRNHNINIYEENPKIEEKP